MTTHGTVASGYGAVREAFERNFTDFDEVGASVAATVDGDMVVDLWGGTATYLARSSLVRHLGLETAPYCHVTCQITFPLAATAP